MSVSRNTSLPEIQPATGESMQAAANRILNQDVKKDGSVIASDNQDKSSPPEVQPAHESNQTTTSDANNHDTAVTPQFEATTDESTKAATTQIPDSDATAISTHDPGNSSPPEVQPTAAHETSITQIPDSGANKHATSISTHDPGNSSPPEVQPTAAHDTSTTQIPDSDANKHATAISTYDPGNSSPPEVQPTAAHEMSTAQIPDPGNSSPPEVQPTTAPETSATQIPDSDANKQATAISTHDPGISSPLRVPPTTHDSTEGSIAKILNSDANKNGAENAFDDPGNSLPPKIEASNREPTSITQTDPQVANSDTTTALAEIQHATDPPTEIVSTDSHASKDIHAAAPTAERKHLLNLIDQELKFVEMNCPKLGKHQEHIKKEAEEAANIFRNLKNEDCELKELKDLKKIVTKLKLQIPAKYRTYDESDQQKNLQSDGSTGNRGAIPAKLQKRMPQLHNKLFHNSPFCKTIKKRYDDLKPELKLCLLCFSVFPENAIISRRLMVYWWIGEGLVPSEDEIEVGKTAEDIANEFFRELMDNNFIEPVSKRHGRNVAICKMHPLVRAALVMIADKVRFFDFDEYGNPKDFGKFDEIETPEEMPVIYPLGDPREFFDFFNENRNETRETIAFSDSNGSPTPFADLMQDENLPPVDRNGKQIDTSKKYYFYRKKKITTRSYSVCLMGSGLSKGLPWEKLHMLFNVKDDILEFKPEWFLRMKNVNVVFLGRWQSSATHHIEVEEFKLEESLEHMNHLRFFSLQGVSTISDLPKSISKLENLLILDLRACHSLESLPNTIGSLKCLTHLDMSECYLLEHMPKEISSLVSLQVLKGFVVVDSPARHACTLHDLAKLQNLKKLSMYTHMKDFPQESHFDALKKFGMLRKLTIAWGGHESKPETVESKADAERKKKDNLASKVMKLVPKKQWVKGSFRRMNAFNNVTLGSRLQKLDLKCFPNSVTPMWLTPGSLQGLKKLYIRGGQFSDLGQFQDVFDWDTKPIPAKETWNVEVLRLKYLDELEMNWRELQSLFPKMTYLEKVKCPKLTLFPCDESGVWTKKTTTKTTRY